MWKVSNREMVAVVAVSVMAAAGPVPSQAQAGQGRNGGAPACRTGIATYRIATTGPGVTSTIDGSCTFDQAAVEGTCTNRYSDTAGRRFTSIAVTRHASQGDVVDEVSVNPPRSLALETTTTIAGAGMNSTSTSLLTYDSRRRLTGITAVTQPGGQTSTTAFTAWDAAGRPTAATLTAGRQGATQAISYNDATRTQSMTSGGVTCTQTFDENGNPAVGRCGGGTATTTVLTTQQVCR